MPGRACILGLVLLLAGAAAAQERVLPTPVEAQKFLETEGLLKNGAAWISPAESRLRMLLDSQEPLERRFHKAELARWEALHVRQSLRLADEVKKEVRDVPRCRVLEHEQTLARTQYERYARLLKGSPSGPRPATELKEEELRRKVVESIEARTALTISILQIRELPDSKILASYEQARQNAEVGMALAALGHSARLGPLKRYDALRRDQDKPAADVLTDVAPIYLNEGRYCLTGLAGDRLSINFEYAPEYDLSLLGELEARELGIPLTNETITLSIGDRKVDAWRVKIPAIRFGRYVLRDIPAAVLPRKESKTSPRLGRGAFRGFEVELQVDRLEMRLNSHAEGSARP